MKLVYICSPLRGDIENNIKKAISYCKYAATKNVVPLAPHTIFTQYLNDNIPKEREQGLYMGIQLLKKCDEIWVFGNRISEGMSSEIKLAKKLNIPIKYIDTNKIEIAV